MVFILVLITIVVLLAVDAWMQHRAQSSRSATPEALHATLDPGLFLHPGHSWLQIDRAGTVNIGVDGFVRGLVGEPDQILPRPVGAWVRQGQPMLAVGRAGRHLQIPAPITGRIEAVNPEMECNPGWWGARNRDGWSYTVRPTDLDQEISALRVGEAAAGWLRAQTTRLSAWLVERSMVRGQFAPTLPDGGAPVEGALDLLEADAWRDFEYAFLPEGSSWSW